MAEFLLKYADARGEVHRETAQASSAEEARERLVDQGFLVYSVRPKGGIAALAPALSGRRQKLNIEKFLIFNQQFVTLFRAGLPILKALDLLADRLTDTKLGPYVRAVRDDVKKGALLSDAFAARRLPADLRDLGDGRREERRLGEVLDRYVTYQKLSLAVRKKLLVSLIYPSVLFSLVIVLIVFLITFVVPHFATLYQTIDANLPLPDADPDGRRRGGPQYIWRLRALVLAVSRGLRFWAGGDAAQISSTGSS